MCGADVQCCSVTVAREGGREVVWEVDACSQQQPHDLLLEGERGQRRIWAMAVSTWPLMAAKCSGMAPLQSRAQQMSPHGWWAYTHHELLELTLVGVSVSTWHTCDRSR